MGKSHAQKPHQPYKSQLRYEEKQRKQAAHSCAVLDFLRQCPQGTPLATGILLLCAASAMMPTASASVMLPNKPTEGRTTVCFSGKEGGPAAFSVSNLGESSYRGSAILGQIVEATQCVEKGVTGLTSAQQIQCLTKASQMGLFAVHPNGRQEELVRNLGSDYDCTQHMSPFMARAFRNS